jgi:hypothetical protein
MAATGDSNYPKTHFEPPCGAYVGRPMLERTRTTCRQDKRLSIYAVHILYPPFYIDFYVGVSEPFLQLPVAGQLELPVALYYRISYGKVSVPSRRHG